MAITVYENKEASKSRVKLDRRIYTTGAGKLVEEGHADAAVLYGSAGKEVGRADFEARGGVAVVDVTDPENPVLVDPKPKPKAKRKTKKRK